MMWSSMWLNILIALCVGLLTYGMTVYFDGTPKPAPQIIEAPVETIVAQSGETVPDFSFMDTKGTTHSIRDFKGKTVILNFWASWCAPCVKEFPDLLNIAAQNKDNAVLIALSSDIDQSAMNRFIDKMKADKAIHFSDNVYIALDNKNITQNIFQTFRLPETIIIGPDQTLKHKLVGANWDRDELMTLLRTP